MLGGGTVRLPILGRLVQGALAVAAIAAPAWAACPQIPCDCMGAARNFVATATGQVRLLVAHQTNPRAYDDLCARQVYLGSVPFPAGANTRAESIVATAASGKVGATLIGASNVFGDVVTGGGSVRQQGDVSIGGVIDTSGDDPRVATCQQAMLDGAAASATLGGLLPTRPHLGSIRLRGESMSLTADPGVNVWTADLIDLRAGGPPDFHPANLAIALAPDTESVIINVGRVKLANGANILSTDAKRVVVNVPGPGSPVVLTRYASVRGFLLAPERTVRMETQQTSTVVGREIRYRASEILAIACP